MIPSGGDDLSGWQVLRDCIRRICAFVDGAAAAPQQAAASSSHSQQPQEQQQQGAVAQQGATSGQVDGAAVSQIPQPLQLQQQLQQQQQQQQADGLLAQQLKALDVSHGSTVGPGHAPPMLSTSPRGTPVLDCPGRRVFFDLGATPRGGEYMRITQVANQDRCVRWRGLCCDPCVCGVNLWSGQ